MKSSRILDGWKKKKRKCMNFFDLGKKRWWYGCWWSWYFVHSYWKWKGTPIYCGPEGFQNKMGFGSDVWSLGVVFYEILRFVSIIPFFTWERFALGCNFSFVHHHHNYRWIFFFFFVFICLFLSSLFVQSWKSSISWSLGSWGSLCFSRILVWREKKYRWPVW